MTSIYLVFSSLVMNSIYYKTEYEIHTVHKHNLYSKMIHFRVNEKSQWLTSLPVLSEVLGLGPITQAMQCFLLYSA